MSSWQNLNRRKTTRVAEVALVVVEVLAEAGVEGEEDLVVGEVEVVTQTSGQETGLARTQGKDRISCTSHIFPSCWFYFRFLKFESFCFLLSILANWKG